MKFVSKNWKLLTLLILSLIIIILALIYIPRLQVDYSGITDLEKRFEAENEARKTIAQIIGGAAILIGLFFSWRTLESQKENLELQREDLKASREGQITERFTRAIDQLGSRLPNGEPNLEVRIGGIYALERIARDSPDDHWTIMEILTTYIRENAPRTSYDEQLNLQNKSQDSEITELVRYGIKTDIQAILTVYGRRESKYDRNNGILFLHYTDLNAAKLYDSNCENLFLMGVNLELAWMSNSSFRRTTFKNANLNNAFLDGADLTGANIEESSLNESNLVGAILKNANLRNAILTNVNLTDANLTGSNLEGANLNGANLSNTLGLTIEQLCLTKTLYKANLNTICKIEGIQNKFNNNFGEWDYWEGGKDIDCLQGVKEMRPELLEEPK